MVEVHVSAAVYPCVSWVTEGWQHLLLNFGEYVCVLSSVIIEGIAEMQNEMSRALPVFSPPH